MKTLYLVRHAKAVGLEADETDSERSLTKKGRKDAQRIARKLKKKSKVPQLIISSPAKRAVKTARILANELNYSIDMIAMNDTLYESPEEGGEEALLEVLKHVDNEYQSVMFIGHDPLLSSFANFLQKSFTEKLPAGAVVEVEFANNSWSTISKGRGKVAFFDYAGRNKQLLNDMEADLQEKIEKEVGRVLSKTDAELTETMAKSIKNLGGKLAKAFVKEYHSKAKAKAKKKAEDSAAREAKTKEARSASKEKTEKSGKKTPKSKPGTKTKPEAKAKAGKETSDKKK